LAEQRRQRGALIAAEMMQGLVMRAEQRAVGGHGEDQPAARRQMGAQGLQARRIRPDMLKHIEQADQIEFLFAEAERIRQGA
jgi:hypothetical protein